MTPETIVMTGRRGRDQRPGVRRRRSTPPWTISARSARASCLQVPRSFPLPRAGRVDPQVAALGPIPSRGRDGRAVHRDPRRRLDQTAEHVDELDAIRERVQHRRHAACTCSASRPRPRTSRRSPRRTCTKGESIGVVVAIIVLLVVFGSLIAGVTPIIMGIFAIGIAFGLVGRPRQRVALQLLRPEPDLDDGAGGRDRLLAVHRVAVPRGAARGLDNLEAIGRSGATANRAVFFSGLTVVLALAGMLLVPTTIFRGLAGGAILVVLVSIALSMTCCPRSWRSSPIAW